MSRCKTTESLIKHKNILKNVKNYTMKVNKLLLIDESLQEFANKFSINHLWIVSNLKDMRDNFFIISNEQFFNFWYNYYLNNDLPKLLNLLEDLKLIRRINDQEFLLTELLSDYSIFINKYSVDELMMRGGFDNIDDLPVDEAIMWYERNYDKNPSLATIGYCRYYNICTEEMSIFSLN